LQQNWQVIKKFDMFNIVTNGLVSAQTEVVNKNVLNNSDMVTF
jgi:hypothetical protein